MLKGIKIQEDMKKLIVWGAAAVAGIVVLILLIVLLVRTAGNNRRVLPTLPEAEVTDIPLGFADPQTAASSIYLPEIVIPNEVERFWSVPWEPYRERKTQWSIGDIEEFWYDPVLVGTETLAERNREHVRAMLDEID